MILLSLICSSSKWKMFYKVQTKKVRVKTNTKLFQLSAKQKVKRWESIKTRINKTSLWLLTQQLKIWVELVTVLKLIKGSNNILKTLGITTRLLMKTRTVFWILTWITWASLKWKLVISFHPIKIRETVRFPSLTS